MTDIKRFMEDVLDKHGEDAIVTNKAITNSGIISTGSLALDVSLGVGGIPRGKFSEIFGPESSGKTTVAIALAGQALKEGLNVLYLDTERSTDYKYMHEIIGDFDEEKLIILSPNAAEDFFGIAEDALNSGAFGLIIFDSLGGASPRKEMEDDLEDANVALLARLLTKWLRRNSFKVKKSNTAFVFLNQVRSSIGSYMGGYESPGGHALKHFLAVKVKFTKGGKILSGKDKSVSGILTKFTVVKNKMGVPFRSFTLPIIFGKGIDYYRDVLEFTSSLGIIRKAGSYYSFGKETLGQGKEKSAKYLEEHPETLDKIVEMCYNVLGSDKLVEEKEAK